MVRHAEKNIGLSNKSNKRSSGIVASAFKVQKGREEKKSFFAWILEPILNFLLEVYDYDDAI